MTSVGAPLAPLAPPATAGARPRPRRRRYVTGSFVSAARGGVATNWAIARPPGQTGPLRPVIALHGKGGDAAQVMAGGVEQGLAQAVAAGIPPFAVVAVDGGGSYWHKRASGEDSGAMVLDELIPMLSSQGLDTSRVGLPRLVDGRLRRTAARRPTRARAHGGDLRGQPGAVDVVGRRRLPARSTAPTTSPPTACGVCPRSGRSRSESTAATAIRSTRPPSSSSRSCPTRPSGGFSPGGHDGAFWSSQLPAEIAWMAPLLTA